MKLKKASSEVAHEVLMQAIDKAVREAEAAGLEVYVDARVHYSPNDWKDPQNWNAGWFRTKSWPTKK